MKNKIEESGSQALSQALEMFVRHKKRGTEPEGTGSLIGKIAQIFGLGPRLFQRYLESQNLVRKTIVPMLNDGAKPKTFKEFLKESSLGTPVVEADDARKKQGVYSSLSRKEKKKNLKNTHKKRRQMGKKLSHSYDEK